MFKPLKGDIDSAERIIQRLVFAAFKQIIAYYFFNCFPSLFQVSSRSDLNHILILQKCGNRNSLDDAFREQIV